MCQLMDIVKAPKKTKMRQNPISEIQCISSVLWDMPSLLPISGTPQRAEGRTPQERWTTVTVAHNSISHSSSLATCRTTEAAAAEGRNREREGIGERERESLSTVLLCCLSVTSCHIYRECSWSEFKRYWDLPKIAHAEYWAGGLGFSVMKWGKSL